MEDITPPSSPTPPPATAGEDKTAAIVCYLTLIGFIVAIILNSNKKTKLGAFHLRQAMGFILTGFLGGICVAILCAVIGVLLAFIIKFLAVIVVWLIYFSFVISMLALWVMGLIAAINGQMKPMPVVGPMYQKWFGTAFE